MGMTKIGHGRRGFVWLAVVSVLVAAQYTHLRNLIRVVVVVIVVPTILILR